jgi:hypothetical protein
MTRAKIRDANGSWVVRIPHEVRDEYELTPGTVVDISGTDGAFLVLDGRLDVETRARLTAVMCEIIGAES